MQQLVGGQHCLPVSVATQSLHDDRKGLIGNHQVRLEMPKALGVVFSKQCLSLFELGQRGLRGRVGFHVVILAKTARSRRMNSAAALCEGLHLIKFIV